MVAVCVRHEMKVFSSTQSSRVGDVCVCECVRAYGVAASQRLLYTNHRLVCRRVLVCEWILFCGTKSLCLYGLNTKRWFVHWLCSERDSRIVSNATGTLCGSLVWVSGLNEMPLDVY